MISLAPLLCDENFADLLQTTRERAFTSLSRKYRGTNGQFFTPYPIARFMSSLFTFGEGMRLLDAGAGVGALSLSTVEYALNAKHPPKDIEVVCFEKEPGFTPILEENLGICQKRCWQHDIAFRFRIISEDFILRASAELSGERLFCGEPLGSFTHVILNPPYKKLRSDSEHRVALRSACIETSNLYTAFLWLSLRLLDCDGQLSAITPRSFCNGPYFRPFRHFLLNEAAFSHIHCIEKRKTAFGDDDVLQENIIFHALKSCTQNSPVTLSTGDGAKIFRKLRVNPADVISRSDPEVILHLMTGDADAAIRHRIESLPCRLDDLGITVSTGPIVEFRVKEHLRANYENATVPLLYPCHFNGKSIHWPRHGHKKPNAISPHPIVDSQLLPTGYYTLVKRFTAKEERKRVVAVVLSPDDLPPDSVQVGIENHINYFHSGRTTLEPDVARGLYGYLNSTLVDDYLRMFNGHTQINATDLRKLRYPTRETLIKLGQRCWQNGPITQDTIDRMVEQLIVLAPPAAVHGNA